MTVSGPVINSQTYMAPILHEARKKQHETKQLKTKDRGQYAFCFGNKFSTFEHKIVYFYLGIGEEERLTEQMAQKATALTQVNRNLFYSIF